MVAHHILSCFILLFGTCGSTYAQLGNWKKFGSAEYFISFEKYSYGDAKTMCRKYGGKIAILNTEASQNSVKQLLQGSGHCYYVGMTSILTWEDGTKVNMSRILYSNATQCGCVALDKRNTNLLLSSPPCSTPSYIVCENLGTSKENKTASLINAQSPPFKPTSQTSTQPISVISNGFSLDLVSFLVGLGIPMPFLIGAVIWIICRKYKKKGLRDRSRSKRSGRNEGSTTPEAVYDVPTDTHGADYVQYANYESYEVPISSHTNDYVEPQAYEDYNFQESYYQNH